MVEALVRELHQPNHADNRTRALAQVLNLPHVEPRQKRARRRLGRPIRRRGEAR
jgi:hypothetical protein